MTHAWLARAVTLAVALAASGAQAADLRIAVSSAATALDPAYQNATPNNAVARNMFETLVKMDPDSRIVPGLAQSWRLVNDTTWEFKLRPAKFHDGTDLTAEDVVWSLDRPSKIANSPSSFMIFTKSIVEKRVIDAHTIQLVTARPYPLLLADMASVFIVSKQATEGLQSAEFATGRGMVGTGPYRFSSFLRDDRVVVTGNAAYWGGKPDWDKVEIRFIASDPARLAAMLAGDVDAIDNVPTVDLANIQADKRFVTAAKKSQRLVFLFLESGREPAPSITDSQGKPLDKNPLRDVRVRRAINMAIDRGAIRDRIMTGLAYPTNNIVTDAMMGFEPGLEAAPYNPTEARKLLAEAGYPNGFSLTLAAPNNRLVNDSKVSQAVAQMLTRIGIKTQVDSMPFSVINTRGSAGEFSLSMMAWGVQTAEASSPIRAMIACPDKDKGWGVVNWGHYCNPAVDAVLTQAVSTMDDTARAALLQQAVTKIIDDVAIVPLYFQATTWAAVQGIQIVPRTDEVTSAESFKPAR